MTERDPALVDVTCPACGHRLDGSTCATAGPDTKPSAGTSVSVCVYCAAPCRFVDALGPFAGKRLRLVLLTPEEMEELPDDIRLVLALARAAIKQRKSLH